MLLTITLIASGLLVYGALFMLTFLLGRWQHELRQSALTQGHKCTYYEHSVKDTWWLSIENNGTEDLEGRHLTCAFCPFTVWIVTLMALTTALNKQLNKRKEEKTQQVAALQAQDAEFLNAVSEAKQALKSRSFDDMLSSCSKKEPYGLQ